jgi:hypothetical protein
VIFCFYVFFSITHSIFYKKILSVYRSLPRGATRAAPKPAAVFPLFSSPATPPPELAIGMAVRPAGMVAARLSSSRWWRAPQQADKPSLARLCGVDVGACYGCGGADWCVWGDDRASFFLPTWSPPPFLTAAAVQPRVAGPWPRQSDPMPGSRIWTLSTGSASAAGSWCGGGSWLGLVQVLWGGALFFATSPLTALTAAVVGATTSFSQAAHGVRAVALATTQDGVHGCGQHGGRDICRDAGFGACHPDPVASGQGAVPEIMGHTSCGCWQQHRQVPGPTTLVICGLGLRLCEAAMVVARRSDIGVAVLEVARL